VSRRLACAEIGQIDDWTSYIEPPEPGWIEARHIGRAAGELLRGDLADRILAAAAHPDRWMRPLRGRRLYDNIVELPPEGV
jgi:hypothetical protein